MQSAFFFVLFQSDQANSFIDVSFYGLLTEEIRVENIGRCQGKEKFRMYINVYCRYQNSLLTGCLLIDNNFG